MTRYLVYIPLPAEHADLAETLVRSAACFLDAQGGEVERIDLGSYQRRASRAKGTSEVVTLVAFAGGDADATDAMLDHARIMESVLRSTLQVAGSRSSDVRVFVTTTSGE